jgi:hypothetical protein
MLPTECRMPDISDLEYPLKRRLLPLVMFFEEPGGSLKEGLLRRNFVRLVDKAIREYGNSRKLIISQIEEMRRPAKDMANLGRSLPLLDFTDHFENCINAVLRLLNQVEVIKKQPAPSNLLQKEVRRLLKAHEKSIREVRNSAEHMEEDILNGEIGVGDPVMLMVDDQNADGAVLGPWRIGFSDLAIVLRRLHQIASAMLQTWDQPPSRSS